MLELLKQYFGYDQFRPMQEEIVQSVVSGRDTFVLLPTGGGKSLCFQLPALKLEGVTLVISPLIALMKDQVDSLQANGIGAACIHSAMGREEKIQVIDDLKEGKTKLLYVAPERIALDSFQRFLQNKTHVSLIAIDEAHCISQWGHDFRPDYGKLSILKSLFPDVAIVALTATATKQVQDDIVQKLQLAEPAIFCGSFDRPNLSINVWPKRGSFDKICHLLARHKNESAIIYCFSRNETEKLAKKLQDTGYDALPYHAGLPANSRNRYQELFVKDEVNIMVATIAFGMGIDKPDVRLVVHTVFPKSLEGYYQEIGRAGRDGLPSDCVLLYSTGDKRKHMYFLDGMHDEQERQRTLKKINTVMNYAEETSCRRASILRYFGEEHSECGNCDICLGDIPEEAQFAQKKASGLAFDEGLFQELRALRKGQAKEKGIAPFMVFSDVSLHQMAYYLPESESEFLSISGVGQQKCDQYALVFVEIISTYSSQHGLKKPQDSSIKRTSYKRERTGRRSNAKGYLKTQKLLEQNKSVEDIAEMQGYTYGTILNHIEKLVQTGEDCQLDHLWDSDPENFETIKKAFLHCGAEKLRPVFDHLGGRYDYDMLKLVRCLMSVGG